jgi:MFS transporter, ACS family, aldohexuronate transporter
MTPPNAIAAGRTAGTPALAGPAELSPSRRWTIVGLLSASIMINLLDRQTLAVLAPFLRDPIAPGSPHWQWTNTQYSYIAVAFNLGMMIGQIPAGTFIDRVGTRVGLATIFSLWTAICALHAFAGPGTVIESLFGGVYGAVPFLPAITGAGLAGFIVLRFMMGLAECGNYTAGIKALAGLFPAATRSRAGGFFNAGAQFGSVIAPPLILVLLIDTFHVSWQWGFVIPALLGSLWLIPWLSIFPSKERMTAIALKPAATAAAPAATSQVGLGQLLTNRKVLGLLLVRMCTGPITTFYWTWLPLYLRSPVESGGRGMSFLAIGIFASIPNLIGMGGNVVGGIVTDKLVKATGSVDKGRKIGFACAFGLGALSMAMPWVTNDYVAVILMGLALFGNQWVAAAYIGTVGDVVPQQLAGRVAGINGFGDNAASLLAVLLTGAIIERYGWSQVFVGAGMLPILALLSVFLVLGRIEPARFGALDQRA